MISFILKSGLYWMLYVYNVYECLNYIPNKIVRFYRVVTAEEYMTRFGCVNVD